MFSIAAHKFLFLFRSRIARRSVGISTRLSISYRSWWPLRVSQRSIRTYFATLFFCKCPKSGKICSYASLMTTASLPEKHTNIFCHSWGICKRKVRLRFWYTTLTIATEPWKKIWKIWDFPTCITRKRTATKFGAVELPQPFLPLSQIHPTAAITLRNWWTTFRVKHSEHVPGFCSCPIGFTKKTIFWMPWKTSVPFIWYLESDTFIFRQRVFEKQRKAISTRNRRLLFQCGMFGEAQSLKMRLWFDAIWRHQAGTVLVTWPEVNLRYAICAAKRDSIWNISDMLFKMNC